MALAVINKDPKQAFIDKRKRFGDCTTGIKNVLFGNGLKRTDAAQSLPGMPGDWRITIHNGFECVKGLAGAIAGRVIHRY